MTDVSTNGPDPGSIDAVAESMLITPVVDAEHKLKSKKKKIASSKDGLPPSIGNGAEGGEGSGVELPTPASETDALQSATDSDSADELLGATEELPEETRDADEASTSETPEEGEETLFDEWADYDDPKPSASADDGPDDDGSDGGEAQPLDLADDAIISVTVDGESQTATIAELKKRYAGEGAIEKRLQDATELKKVAVQQVAHNRDKLAEVLNVVGQLLFTPSVPAPDPALARAEPGAYLEQQTLHQQELTMLANRKSQLQAALVKSDEDANLARNELRAEEAAKLRTALPVLSDAVRGPKVQKAILSAAKEFYGFSDGDIAAAQDHRIFVMAADAMRYRKIIAKSKARPVTDKPRTIRPSGSSNRPKVSGAIKKERAQMTQARKTGSVDDVAATILVTKKPRGRRRR